MEKNSSTIDRLYEVAVQVAGLYALALDALESGNELAAADYRKLSDQWLSCVSLTWNLAEKWRADFANPKLDTRVEQSQRRMERIHRSVSIWIATSRWHNLMGRVERMWERLLAEFEAESPAFVDILKLLRAKTKERQSDLSDLEVAELNRVRELNKNFAVPRAL